MIKGQELKQNIMKGECEMFKKVIAGTGLVIGLASNAMAAFALPDLPTSDLESAGTAVAALIAVAVVIGVVFRLMKKA
jgi:hypothetical protein